MSNNFSKDGKYGETKNISLFPHRQDVCKKEIFQPTVKCTVTSGWNREDEKITESLAQVKV